MLTSLLPIAFGVLALLIGRWWAVLIPVATWTVLAGYLVVHDGWYGHGWGDFGVLLTLLSAVASLLAAAIGVGARGGIRRAFGGSRQRRRLRL